ncbi:MAG: stage III sporulation protein AD [Lachnospiraceae bacterium]|nr:stage III sporulation protein AD [Lachnospiraceae bacterium]
MEIYQVVSVGIIGTVLSVTLKKYSPEYSVLVGVGTSIIIFLFVLTRVGGILEMFGDIADDGGIDKGYVGIVVKIIAIAYITQFGAELCMDAGEKAIASKIELAGKVLIMMVSTPVIIFLMNLIMSI